MGLDIRIKKSRSDSFGFNWTGVRNFEEWNKNKGLPNPFPGWNGANDGNDLNKKLLRQWIKAFEKMYPQVKINSAGVLMRDAMFMIADDMSEKPMYKEEYRDWNLYTAIAYYLLVKDGIKNGFQFY